MPMTDQKVLEAVAALRAALVGDNRLPIRLTPELQHGRVFALMPIDVDQHVLFMCEEIPRLLAEGRREKAMRWLGFLQGFAWGGGYCCLVELKDMNKPEGATEG